MADWEHPHPLTSLVDPPLAGPPPLDEIEDRARRHRNRRRIGTGAGAGLAVIALVAGVVAMSPGGEQAVHTAATGGGQADGNAASPALGQREPFPDWATVHEFDSNGIHWRVVATRQLSGAVCLGLMRNVGSGDATVSPPCWTPDDRPIQAAALSNSEVSYVFGIAAKSVTEVAIKEPAAQATIFGLAAGYPVHFFGQVIDARTGEVELRALGGTPAPFFLTVSLGHGRESAVNGQVAAPPAPTTTVVRGQTEPAAPVTTLPIPTTTPPATSPSTTVPPLLGIPKLITVTAGASNLIKARFESAVASGGNGLAVRFWAGTEPCTVLGKVDVVESADKVTVTLWTGSTNTLMMCTALAVQYETIVQLSAPLGARVVVDGAA